MLCERCQCHLAQFMHGGVSLHSEPLGYHLLVRAACSDQV